MAGPLFIRTVGLFLPLNTEAEIKRGNQLVRKRPEKYLVDEIYPSGGESPTPLLHDLAHADEGLLIKGWVETGQGTEPD
jgi:hypothetical protein